MERGSVLRPLSLGLSAAALVVGLLFGAHFFTAQAEASPVIQVRWLVSHQPVDVFDRAAEVFARELSRASNGEMRLVMVTPEEIGIAKEGDISQLEIESLLDQGTVDLASSYTIPLGSRDQDFWSLNLPYLFETYDEAISVLDGPVGMGILQGLSKQTNLRGLAFTMSGGFRIIASKDMQVTTSADLVGRRIGTSGGPVAEATLKALGAIPVTLNLENGTPPDLAGIDGLETTYARLSGILGTGSPYMAYINETNHSIFLTAIMASDSFYDSLSADQQAALQKAALRAAAAEREDSIALNAQTKVQLKREGSTISELPREARDEFKATLESVYRAFPALANIVRH